MTYLNQFHKEAMERTMKKVEESKKSPMNSRDFAEYMRHNLEKAKQLTSSGMWFPAMFWLMPMATCML